jgi:hypothetical protein
MTSDTMPSGKSNAFVANDPAPSVFIQEDSCGAQQGNARMKSRLCQITILLTVMILGLIPSLAGGARKWAAAHGRGATLAATSTGSSPTAVIGLNLGFAMADFTGDTHPDLATVELNRFDSANAHYLIEIQLTEGGHQFLQLTAPFGGLLITAKDVTGDGNLDLVVRAARSGAPVAVFLNDGFGRFSPAAPAKFSQALRETPYELRCTTDQTYFSATLISSKFYTAEGQSGSARNRPRGSGSLFSANDGGPFDLFLAFGQSRAPPAAA